MRNFAIVILFFLLAAPAFGAVTPCTTQMVTAGLCRAEVNTMLHWDADPAILVELRDAIASQYGYREQVTCTQEMVDALLCDVGELDTVIDNPITKTQFADAWIRQALLSVVIRQRAIDDVAAAKANVDTDVDLE
jgi:hypothetical protein